MATIFNLNDDDENNPEQIDIDELFEKKKQHDLNEYNLFKKILGRIHTKIKITSRQKLDEQYIWFQVPDFILGCQKYDQGNCIAFLVDKLKQNDFLVNYYHPNLLFIFWAHVIPKYVRSKIKDKLGVNIDLYGNKIENNKESIKDIKDYNEILLQENKNNGLKQYKKKDDEKFADIKNYIPTGNFTYNKILASQNLKKTQANEK